MSSSTVISAARLSSLSTSTLSQILELTRSIKLNLPSQTLSTSISKNLSKLHNGIEALQRQGTESSSVMNELSSQYKRLVDLVNPLGVVVEFGHEYSHEEDRRTRKGKGKTGRLVDTGDDTGDHDDDELADDNDSSVALHPLTTPHTSLGFPRDDPERDLEQMEEDEETMRRANAEVMQMQKRMIEDQDETLTSLSSAIARQHDLSLHISSELELQSGLLDETDSALDRTESGLRRASGRLNQFSRKAKETGSTGLIVGLVILLLILVVVFKL